MRLFIMRHGQADHGQSLENPPLSLVGEKEARHAGENLKKFVTGEVHVWHSPLLRAQLTARIVKDSAGLSGDFREVAEITPGGNPELWSTRLEAEAEDVLVVTHMPFVAQLMAQLLLKKPGEQFVMYTASLAVLRKWDGGWLLEALIPPMIRD